MAVSCGYIGTGLTDNSYEELSGILNSIMNVSNEAKVDPRFVLVIMMQESAGCVRVDTTDSPILPNPGLMQSHNGTNTCNNGSIIDPCPDKIIYGMIEDGVQGTYWGDGLAQLLDKAIEKSGQLLGQPLTPNDAQTYYWAARMYNSGADSVNLMQLEDNDATKCYASDIANRLTGWFEDGSGDPCPF